MSRPDLLDLLHRLKDGDPSVLEEFAPMLDRLDPQIQWDVSAMGLPDMNVFHGRDGVVRLWIDWLAEWERYSFKANDFEAIADHVIYDVHIEGISRSGHVPVQCNRPIC